jgi:hypothetical protein
MDVKAILLIRLIIRLALCSRRNKYKKFVNGHKIIQIFICYSMNFMLILFMDKLSFTHVFNFQKTHKIFIPSVASPKTSECVV